MKTKRFKLPLYAPTLYVVVGKVTGEELYRYGKKVGVDIPNLKAEGYERSCGSCNFKDGVVILWLEKVRAGLLAHECLHAVNFILKDAGITPTESSEEAYTYLLEWMVEAVWKNCR